MTRASVCSDPPSEPFRQLDVHRESDTRPFITASQPFNAQLFIVKRNLQAVRSSISGKIVSKQRLMLMGKISFILHSLENVRKV